MPHIWNSDEQYGREKVNLTDTVVLSSCKSPVSKRRDTSLTDGCQTVFDGCARFVSLALRAIGLGVTYIVCGFGIVVMSFRIVGKAVSKYKFMVSRFGIM